MVGNKVIFGLFARRRLFQISFVDYSEQKVNFRFWNADFGFKVSPHFGFWILDFGLRIADLRYLRILDFGLRIADLGYSACRESFVEGSILK